MVENKKEESVEGDTLSFFGGKGVYNDAGKCVSWLFWHIQTKLAVKTGISSTNPGF